jgi:hypothetical protein
MSEISQEQRLILRRLQVSVRAALGDGVDVELVLDAVAAGLEASSLEGRAFGSSPLALSLTRAFNSSVGSMGGPDPTEDQTSTGPASHGSRPPVSDAVPGSMEDGNWMDTASSGALEDLEAARDSLDHL